MRIILITNLNYEKIVWKFVYGDVCYTIRVITWVFFHFWLPFLRQGSKKSRTCLRKVKVLFLICLGKGIMSFRYIISGFIVLIFTFCFPIAYFFLQKHHRENIEKRKSGKIFCKQKLNVVKMRCE